MMKSKIYFAICLSILLSLLSCTDTKSGAVSQLRDLYEDASQNSNHFTKEEWHEFMVDYARIDSLLNTYDYSREEQKEIDDLRGRCAVYLVKGVANEAASGLDNAIESVGNFLNGLSEELNK